MFRKREVEKAMREGIRTITEFRKIQEYPGTWESDQYMHGLVNGLILAESLFRPGLVDFLRAPKQWARDGDGEDGFFQTQGEGGE